MLGYTLTILSGDQTGQYVVLNDTPLIIGSQENSHLHLTDTSVSQMHAKLYLQDHAPWIEDLGSTHGTLVNGIRIVGRTCLNPGDRIQIGIHTTIRLEGTACPAAAGDDSAASEYSIPEPALKGGPPVVRTAGKLRTLIRSLLITCLCLIGLGLGMLSVRYGTNRTNTSADFTQLTSTPGTHVETLPVPDVIGLREDFAVVTLKTVGFNVQIQITPDENPGRIQNVRGRGDAMSVRNSSEENFGKVTNQSPPAGTRLEAGEVVTIHLSLPDKPSPTTAPTTAPLRPTTTAASSSSPTALPTQPSAAALQPTDTPVPTPTQSPTSAPTQDRCSIALWRGDLTVPDGARMQPGEQFTKVWLVENAGSCAWDMDYRFIFDHGAFGSEFSPYRISFEEVEPGEQISISMDLQAPLEPGIHESHWRMRSSTGEAFGFGYAGDATLYIQIEVIGSENDM